MNMLVIEGRDPVASQEAVLACPEAKETGLATDL
jgi:hypothetical protein